MNFIMPAGANVSVPVIAGLLDKIISELGAKDQREHEQRMQELKLIESSSLKDEYAKQLLLDRLLSPVEKAQHSIQNTAKHAQWLAEMVIFYHKDHGLTEGQAHDLAQQLRLLAIQITNIESLHDLKFTYAVATLLTDKISIFKHRELKYRIEGSIRKGILEPLNTCIATERNFYRRVQLTDKKP